MQLLRKTRGWRTCNQGMRQKVNQIMKEEIIFTPVGNTVCQKLDCTRGWPWP